MSNVSSNKSGPLSKRLRSVFAPSRRDHVEDSQDHKEAIPSGKEVAWGPIAVLFWAFIVYLIPQVVIGSLLSVYPTIKHWDSTKANDWLTNSISAQFVYTVFVEAIAVIIIWRLLKHYKAKFSTIGLAQSKRKDILFMTAGFAVYFVVYLVLVSVLTKVIPALNVNQQQNVGFQSATSGLSLAMAFVSLVVLPPFVEEIIFRGFVFTGLRRKFGFVITALGTSVLFAAPHLLEGTGGGPLWVAGIDTFVLSLVLCYLRERSGRLWAGMGVHALKNSLAFASLFIFHVH